MIRNILITGATGTLGLNLLKILIQNENVNIWLLLRDKKSRDFILRILSETKCLNENTRYFDQRIQFLNGSITNENFNLTNSEINGLANSLTEIYHCAAITGFRLPLDEARHVNLWGTRNILEFSKRCRNLNKVIHISSTFILGDKNAVLNENDLNLGQGFNNSYEQSKYEAELLINEYRHSGLNVFIFRPSIIVGNYDTGEVQNFKLIYEAMKLFSTGLVDVFPGDFNVTHNFIPADLAAKSIYLISTNESKGETYHVISPNNVVCYKFLEAAAKFFGYKNPKWVSLEQFKKLDISPTQRRIIDPFVQYFNYKGKYENQRTVKLLHKYKFTFDRIEASFWERMFNYCKSVGYININQYHDRPYREV